MKKLPLKMQFIIYGSILAVSAVWLIVGLQFVTPDSDGAMCFFGLTLPFLIGLAAIGMLLRLVYRFVRYKKSKSDETIK